MNHPAAYKLLAAELVAYRGIGYDQLRQCVGERVSQRKQGDDDTEYEISVVVRWDNNENGDIRVTGSVGQTAWGAPHDSLDETLVVHRPLPVPA